MWSQAPQTRALLFPCSALCHIPTHSVSPGFLLDLTDGKFWKVIGGQELGKSQVSSPPSLPQAAFQAVIYNLGGTSSHRARLPSSARRVAPRLPQFGLLLLLLQLGSCWLSPGNLGLPPWSVLVFLHPQHLCNEFLAWNSLCFTLQSLFSWLDCGTLTSCAL